MSLGSPVSAVSSNCGQAMAGGPWRGWLGPSADHRSWSGRGVHAWSTLRSVVCVDSELAVRRPSSGWRIRPCGRVQVSAPAAYDVAVTRRWWGIQVLMLVIVAVLVAGVLQRAPVVGSPVAVPVSDAPAVGGCLSEPWKGPPGFGQDGFPVATLPLGSCASAHFGEVFSVVDIPSGVEPSGKDPCLSPTGQSAFRSYLGLPDADMAPGDDPVGGADRTGQWGSELGAAISTIGPDARQRSAGQRWVACVIRPE